MDLFFKLLRRILTEAANRFTPLSGGYFQRLSIRARESSGIPAFGDTHLFRSPPSWCLDIAGPEVTMKKTNPTIAVFDVAASVRAQSYVTGGFTDNTFF
jgi:hypothetical protein